MLLWQICKKIFGYFYLLCLSQVPDSACKKCRFAYEGRHVARGGGLVEVGLGLLHLVLLVLHAVEAVPDTEVAAVVAVAPVVRGKVVGRARIKVTVLATQNMRSI